MKPARPHLLTGVAALTAALALSACDRPASPTAPGTDPQRPTIAVSIPPQAYLARRLVHDFADVAVLVNANQSPHHYEPSPRQMEALTAADVFFTIGAPFEKTLARKLANAAPGLGLVDSRAGIQLRSTTHDCWIDNTAPATHDHDRPADHTTTPPAEPANETAGHHHDHHGTPDPHVWLAPLNAARMAENMAADLVDRYPAHAEQIRANLTSLQADLHALHAELQDTLAPLAGEEILVYHPAYGYLADAYNLRQVPVEIDGKAPSVQQLTDLIQRARKRNVHVIFVQPQFNAAAAQALAREINAVIAPLDPMAEDYMINLRQIADRIAREFAHASE